MKERVNDTFKVQADALGSGQERHQTAAINGVRLKDS